MRWLLVSVLLLPLAGCGDPEAEQVEERTTLPSCGHLEVGQGVDWREADPDAWDCLDTALRGDGEAELRLTYPTVEGDPIDVWYRVADGRLQIDQDSTRDRFGSGEWSHQECAAPDRLPKDVHRLGCP